MIISKKFEISLAYNTANKGIIGSNLSILFCFKGEPHVDTGMAADISELKRKISQTLLVFDHHCLDPIFRDKVECFKFITEELWNVISPIDIDGVKLHAVYLAECAGLEILKTNDCLWFINSCFLSNKHIFTLENQFKINDILANPVSIKVISNELLYPNLEFDSGCFPLDILKMQVISSSISENKCKVKWILLNGLLEVIIDKHTISAIISTYFDFSHRLNNTIFDADKNADLFGKCNRLHGHRYHLSITLETSDSLFYDDINTARDVLRNLTGSIDLPQGFISTGENLLLYFQRQLSKTLKKEPIQIRLMETPNNIFYFSNVKKEDIFL